MRAPRRLAFPPGAPSTAPTLTARPGAVPARRCPTRTAPLPARLPRRQLSGRSASARPRSAPRPAPSHRPGRGQRLYLAAPLPSAAEGGRRRLTGSGKRGKEGALGHGRGRRGGNGARVGAASRTCPSGPRCGGFLVIEGKTPPRAKPANF